MAWPLFQSWDTTSALCLEMRERHLTCFSAYLSWSRDSDNAVAFRLTFTALDLIATNRCRSYLRRFTNTSIQSSFLHPLSLSFSCFLLWSNLFCSAISALDSWLSAPQFSCSSSCSSFLCSSSSWSYSANREAVPRPYFSYILLLLHLCSNRLTALPHVPPAPSPRPLPFSPSIPPPAPPPPLRELRRFSWPFSEQMQLDTFYDEIISPE